MDEFDISFHLRQGWGAIFAIFKELEGTPQVTLVCTTGPVCMSQKGILFKKSTPQSVGWVAGGGKVSQSREEQRVL